MTADQIQAEWDRHVDTALDITRTDEETERIAARITAGYRAWNLRTARKDAT